MGANERVTPTSVSVNAARIAKKAMATPVSYDEILAFITGGGIGQTNHDTPLCNAPGRLIAIVSG